MHVGGVGGWGVYVSRTFYRRTDALSPARCSTLPHDERTRDLLSYTEDVPSRRRRGGLVGIKSQFRRFLIVPRIVRAGRSLAERISATAAAVQYLYTSSVRRRVSGAARETSYSLLFFIYFFSTRQPIFYGALETARRYKTLHAAVRNFRAKRRDDAATARTLCEKLRRVRTAPYESHRRRKHDVSAAERDSTACFPFGGFSGGSCSRARRVSETTATETLERVYIYASEPYVEPVFESRRNFSLRAPGS